ncbi:MAG: hypothetical protein ACD_3C00045G0003 [uncultured bacterium (gcode 4)]|uniref:Uncharacterized protein n=1 Tax=uncultured bacterium (gcode 4) TaxID=1234023 RepID=K2G2R5_9BACT|nr:MAG: hypothetical protein ACD_3C00045G0003 [uncultured bacterium (gcode 4)]
MKIWMIGSGISKLEVLDVMMRRQFEVISYEWESTEKEKGLLYVCPDIWTVHDLSTHIRENVGHLIALADVSHPVSLWVVYTWTTPWADEIVDRLRIDIEEILWEDSNKIIVDLLNEEEVKRKQIMICAEWMWPSLSSIIALKSLHADRDFWYIPSREPDWQPWIHKSGRGQLKESNCRFALAKKFHSQRNPVTLKQWNR